MTSLNTPSRVTGHRGVPSLAPENTLGGFRKAAEIGVGWIELDVTLLADGTPVVSHDATTGRCGNRNELLQQCLPAELDGLNMAARLPDWPTEPLPLLTDTLVLLHRLGLGLNLEIKDHGLPAPTLVSAVLAALDQTAFPSEQLLISSFSRSLLAECQLQAPLLRRGLLVDDLPCDWHQQAQQLALFSLHVHWRQLNYLRVQAIKQSGLKLYCWTANEPAEIASFWHWGLDGVITDYPQRFNEIHDVE
ncbi:glycerophosphoryl diester phosphodiesterase [Marinobacterium sp. AK62]|uniref:Glycerophosphoryl diester phosphodiesterase n=1 Tax=Marinobacterium alkalitolerans TaxID=1542925 RepID=A0ABS3Z6F7_9GAMM|nr:glycerophosphodiester phosphodiesterase family protein [Marinobacterium alkalitolerans]MBP0047268.1 glycerophosphoryl diester phosphodiesterase [Marinobacterium alkalitolerans]